MEAIKNILILLLIPCFSLGQGVMLNNNTSQGAKNYLEHTFQPSPEPPSGTDFGTDYDYFVDATNGSDSNTGTSTSDAWQTLNKVNTSSFSAGDKIGLKAGESWDETLIPPSSGTSGNPITFGTYGVGEKAKIYASDEITGWSVYSGNIYQATLSDEINQLFVDGVRMSLARYPKTGYHDITGVTSSTIFTSTDLSSESTDYYADAIMIAKGTAFTFGTTTVSASSGQTLTISATYYGGVGVGKGFFLTNKLEFLTQAGEWYWDDATNTVYLWCPDSDSPSGHTVRGSVRDYGISLSSKDYISIENLEIYHSVLSAIYGTGSTYMSVSNTDIYNPDRDGIELVSSSDNPTIDSCIIDGANFRGIRFADISTPTVTHSTIRNINVFLNINKTAGTTTENVGTGIYARTCNNFTAEYNVIDTVGYCGINWKGSNASIKYNYLNGANMTLSDGGSIYTYNNGTPTASTGSKVMYNIALHSHGVRDGYTDSYDVGYCIYMDNQTQGVDIYYNVAAQSTCGLYSHESGCDWQYNLMYDNLLAIRTSDYISADYFYNNTAYGANRSGDMTWWTNQPQKMVVKDGSSPTLDNNDYYQHYESDAFKYGSGFLSFADWKTNTSQDASSTFDGTSFTTESDTLFLNPTGSIKTFYLNGSDNIADIDGTPISTSFTVPAWGGVVIIDEDGDNFNLISE